MWVLQQEQIHSGIESGKPPHKFPILPHRTLPDRPKLNRSIATFTRNSMYPFFCLTSRTTSLSSHVIVGWSKFGIHSWSHCHRIRVLLKRETTRLWFTILINVEDIRCLHKNTHERYCPHLLMQVTRQPHSWKNMRTFSSIKLLQVYMSCKYNLLCVIGRCMLQLDGQWKLKRSLIQIGQQSIVFTNSTWTLWTNSSINTKSNMASTRMQHSTLYEVYHVVPFSIA